jgi:sec-independent protein translocase protein TatB
MFDITSSKLLILGLVALIVIGPKDLPPLLRTLGRYMGIIKRQAAEFRAQFDEAMRETELEQLKREVETLGTTAEAEMRAAERSVAADLSAAGESVNAAIGGDGKVDPPKAEDKTDPIEGTEDPTEDRVVDGGESAEGQPRPQGAASAAPAANGADTQAATGEAALRAREQSGA